MSKPTNRLKTELSRIQKKPPSNFTLGTSGDDLFIWEATFNGPENSPYEGGKIHCSISIPEDYPQSPPEFFFTPPLYHPNVDQKSGEVCLDKLDKKVWQSKFFLVDVCNDLIELLKEPNPAHSLDDCIGKEFSENIEEFNRKAREWIQKNTK